MAIIPQKLGLERITPTNRDPESSKSFYFPSCVVPEAYGLEAPKNRSFPGSSVHDDLDAPPLKMSPLKEVYSENHRTSCRFIDRKLKAQQPAPVTVELASSEAKVVTHMYSPVIASMINKRQPDLAASALMCDIALWQKLSAGYGHTKINGRRYAFRSLSELALDCPYLSRSAIEKAIHRLEKAFGDGFLVNREQSKLWFSISDDIIGMQNKGALFSFQVDDAVRYGIRSAVLLNNMRFQLFNYPNLKRDADGNRYCRMSPKTLSPILQYSEDTITRALHDLVSKDQLLMRHPDAKGYYAFRPEFENEPENDQKACSAEVNGKAAEVTTNPAKVDSDPAEVDVYEGTGSNQCGNESSKDSKGNYETHSAAPQRFLYPPSLDERMLKMQSVAQEQVAKMHSSKKSKSKRTDAAHIAEVLYWDEAESNLSLNVRFTGQLVEFNAYCRILGPVKDRISQITCFWKERGFPFTKDDVVTLNRFFDYNPLLSGEAIIDLWLQVWNLQYPHHKNDVVIIGNGTFDDPIKDGEFDEALFARKVTDARSFLKLLPKIITQRYSSRDPETNGLELLEEVMPHPYWTINYGYLDVMPTGKYVPPQCLPLPKEFIDDEHEPVF